MCVKWYEIWVPTASGEIMRKLIEKILNELFDALATLVKKINKTKKIYSISPIHKIIRLLLFSIRTHQKWRNRQYVREEWHSFEENGFSWNYAINMCPVVGANEMAPMRKRSIYISKWLQISLFFFCHYGETNRIHAHFSPTLPFPLANRKE